MINEKYKCQVADKPIVSLQIYKLFKGLQHYYIIKALLFKSSRKT